MNAVRMLAAGCFVVVLVGCVSISANEDRATVVQVSARVSCENPAADKSGAFFLCRSMLCRKAFSEAMTNLVAKTGRDEDSLCGATIDGVEEEFANGVYSLRLNVAWSTAREAAASRILSVTNAMPTDACVLSDEEEQLLSTWVGPKQVLDDDGKIHFLGISAMGLGRNTVLSQQNIKRAELDAKAWAVRAFMGKDMKMENVRAEFRQVFKRRGRHPLCPDRQMFACGYEVVSLQFPDR